jgi:hypothetical protein
MLRPVQRHRDDAHRAVEDVGAALAHQRAQPPGDRTSTIVFERVNDRAQCPLVRPDSARTIDGASDPAAARADAKVAARAPPRRQRVAASIAERRGDWQDGAPASLADDASRWLGENLTARGAGRCDQNRGQAVDAVTKQAGQVADDTSIRSALPQSRSRA